MTVQVYRNLNNGLLSIKKNGLVLGHCDQVILYQVKYNVSKKGVERIRKEKRKSVVATISGHINAIQGFVSYKGRSLPDSKVIEEFLQEEAEKITFNPYKNYNFIGENGGIITESTACYINSKGIIKAYED